MKPVAEENTKSALETIKAKSGENSKQRNSIIDFQFGIVVAIFVAVAAMIAIFIKSIATRFSQ